MSKVSFGPISQVVTPKTPQLWGARGDLEPVMAHKQEVVRFVFQPAKICVEGDVPTENIPEDFRWKFGYIQKRVTSAFELDDCRLVLSNLLLQSPYRFYIGFAA